MELDNQKTKLEENKQQKEKGAGMVEYALLVSLVGVALIGALTLLKDNINSSFSSAGTALVGN